MTHGGKLVSLHPQARREKDGAMLLDRGKLLLRVGVRAVRRQLKGEVLGEQLLRVGGDQADVGPGVCVLVSPLHWLRPLTVAVVCQVVEGYLSLVEPIQNFMLGFGAWCS